MMKTRTRHFTPIATFLFLILTCILFSPVAVRSQKPRDPYAKNSDVKSNRQRGLDILKQVKEILKANYYDTNYRGIDLDARFAAAAERIKSQEKNWEIHRTIAQVLIEFNDSHTRWYPPDRLHSVEYGFSMMMIGGGCFVTSVQPGSDAEKKGVGAGDQILSLNDLPPSPDNFWVIRYLIYQLDPQPTLKLKLRKVAGSESDLVVDAKFLTPEDVKKLRKKYKDEEQAKPYICHEIGPELIACKLRTFVVGENVVDKMMKDVGTHKKFILDLRGNGGGYVATEAYLTGYFFENDVKIGTEKTRKKVVERFAKGRKEKAYKGELAVLIDSRSASASEMFAGVIQIEKRGKIIGDNSAGAVVTSLHYVIETPLFTLLANQYSFMSVTIADLVMSDGRRLEGVGLIPDLPVGPSPLALSKRSDPVLAYAAGLFGAPITPEKAGEWHFMIPKQEDTTDDDSGDGKDK